MTIKTTINTFLVALVLGFTMTACGGDDAADCTNWALEIQEESDALSAAGVAYGTDPTRENCQAYIAAFNDYLDEADNLESCAEAGGQLQEYRDALASTRASLDAIQCP